MNNEELTKKICKISNDIVEIKEMNARQMVILETITSKEGLARCADRKARITVLENRFKWVGKVLGTTVAGVVLIIIKLFIDTK